MIYKRLIIIICLLGGTFLSFAQSDSLAHGSTFLSYTQFDSADPGSLARYRKIFWDSIPEPVGYVNDWEGLFTEDEVFQLDSVIEDFDKRTTAQIAVVTIDTHSVSSDWFEKMSNHIFATWGIGTKEKNNGVLILISKGYKMIRIDNGLGIETLVTDNETQQLIDDYFMPDFRNNKYFDGALHGVLQEMALLNTKFK